jgi:pyridoxine 5-phosphate synthase
MPQLSVNINKIATLRNSRGGQVPSVVGAARVCVEAGAPGITVHPRQDERHITRQDVLDLAAFLQPHRETVELNLEGDLRPDFLSLLREIRPHQATLVPVLPGEITSQGGWPADTPREELAGAIAELQSLGMRVSVFVDPIRAAIEWAAGIGADRVELYTEPFAAAFAADPAAGARQFRIYAEAAEQAHALGLGINAGHDLDLANLELFAGLPHLDEVSIGHALISEAVFQGLATVVQAYLKKLQVS